MKNVSYVAAASLLAALLLLSACAELQGDFPAEEAPRSAISQSQVLLNYAAGLRNRGSTELSVELDLLNRAYTQRRTEDNRLRLAIFHAITPNGDRAKALNLLDVPPGEAGRGRSHPIAVMLIPLLQENHRTDDNLSATTQRLRDEQKRADTLQQKLDAIRDIEKKMLERSPGKAP